MSTNTILMYNPTIDMMYYFTPTPEELRNNDFLIVSEGTFNAFKATPNNSGYYNERIGYQVDEWAIGVVNQFYEKQISKALGTDFQTFSNHDLNIENASIGDLTLLIRSLLNRQRETALNTRLLSTVEKKMANIALATAITLYNNYTANNQSTIQRILPAVTNAQSGDTYLFQLSFNALLTSAIAKNLVNAVQFNDLKSIEKNKEKLIENKLTALVYITQSKIDLKNILLETRREKGNAKNKAFDMVEYSAQFFNEFKLTLNDELILAGTHDPDLKTVLEWLKGHVTELEDSLEEDIQSFNAEDQAIIQSWLNQKNTLIQAV